MSKLPLHYHSATELARLLRKGKISAPDLLDLCLERYQAHNPLLNAVVVTDVERARTAAKAAHKRLKKEEPAGPFDGVPMTAKESFDWAGTPSTCPGRDVRPSGARLSPEPVRTCRCWRCPPIPGPRGHRALLQGAPRLLQECRRRTRRHEPGGRQR